MAEHAPTAAFDALQTQLAKLETVTDLYRVGISDDFKRAAQALPSEQLTALRKLYAERRTELDGKVRLQDFVGSVLDVFDVDFWHSSQWDNDGVTLHFRALNGKEYKALTSSSPVVRFCTDLADALPTKQSPVRILLGSRPVRDEKRAAQGQAVFTIKRLPINEPRGDGSENSPF